MCYFGSVKLAFWGGVLKMSDRLFCAQIDPKIEASSPKFSSNLVAKIKTPKYLKPKSPTINGLGESIVLFIKNQGMLLDR